MNTALPSTLGSRRMHALIGCHASVPCAKLGDDHRAGAAVAFGATFLGAGQAAMLAQELEQGGLRRDAGDRERRAVEQEADRLGHRRPRRTPVE